MAIVNPNVACPIGKVQLVGGSGDFIQGPGSPVTDGGNVIWNGTDGVTVKDGGIVLQTGGGGTNFLSDDGTYKPETGAGDVDGPGSAVDGSLAVFDGTTGKLIKDGGVVLQTVGDNPEDLRGNGVYQTPAVSDAYRSTIVTDTITSQDGTILCNTLGASGPITINLAVSAANALGRYFLIQDDGNATVHNITLNALGGRTINNSNGFVINKSGGAILLQSDGTNFFIASDLNRAFSNTSDITVNTNDIAELVKGEGKTRTLLTPSGEGEVFVINGATKFFDVDTSTFSSVLRLSNTFRDKAYQEIIIKDGSGNASNKIIRIERADGSPIEGQSELIINTDNSLLRVTSYANDIHISTNLDTILTSFTSIASDKDIVLLPSFSSTNVARIMWEASTKQLKIFKDTPAAEALFISFRNDGIISGAPYVFPGSGGGVVDSDSAFVVATSAYFSKDGIFDSGFNLVRAQDTINLETLIDFSATDTFLVKIQVKLSSSFFSIDGVVRRLR